MNLREKAIIMLGGVPKKYLPDYYVGTSEVRYQWVYDLVPRVMSQIKSVHPEYHHSTLDKYVFASFAKRFVGEWIQKVNKESFGVVKNPFMDRVKYPENEHTTGS